MSKQTEAMKLALKALEHLQPTALTSFYTIGDRDKAITALREELAEQPAQQEPAAWIERWYGSRPERGWWIVCGRDHIAHLGPSEFAEEAASKIVTAHNTTPPAQRKPLTNGEIYTAYITATNQTLRAQDERLAFAFARAIEAAHGIKENT
jgi:hypothetical protein